MFGYPPEYVLIVAGTMVISWLVSAQLKQKFAFYSRVPLNFTGRQVAEKMLSDHGIHDVQVVSVQGQLTDHYNPLNKTVNLSQSVYGTRSLAAAAVAAHECGHAVQHATAYGPLRFRSAMVPAVTFSTKLANIVIMVGLILAAMTQFHWVFLLGILLFAVTTLFTLITLPVEFDASRRALVWLNKTGMASGDHQGMARDALKWAAMTYVVAALASIANLAYFISLYLRSRR